MARDAGVVEDTKKSAGMKYSTPKLTEFGKVEVLTKGSTGTIADGASANKHV